MILSKKSKSKFAAVSALVLLPLAGAINANAQESAKPVPQTRAESGAFSFVVGGASFLGVQTENITKENSAKYNQTEPRGVGVVKVSENSPAAQSGLRNGDVIVRFEGEEVKSAAKLQRLIQEVAPDQKARVTVLRSGAEQEISVTMGKREGFGGMLPPAGELRRLEDLMRAAPPEGFNRSAPGQNRVEILPPGQLPKLENLPRVENLPRDFKFEIPDGDNFFVFPGTAARSLGVGVSPLTKQLGDYFGVNDGKGLLIQEVREGSPAARAGLRAGDVIVEIEGEAVSRQFDLIRALNKKAEGEINLTIIRDRQRLNLSVAPEKPKTLAPGAATKFKT